MLGKHRPSAQNALIGSIVLGLLCAFFAYHNYSAHKMGWAIFAGVLAVWFFVDAYRASTWVRNIRLQEEAKANAPAGPEQMAQPEATRPRFDSSKTAARANPLMNDEDQQPKS